MGVFLTLVRRELGAAFNSLIGYVVVAITQLLAGFGLMDIVQRLNSDRTPSPIPEIFFADGIVFWLILILTTPVITMRTFASERALGTYEALMTTPVGEWQVVLAKYAGALVFYLLSWAPLVGVLVLLRQLTQQPQLLDPWGMCGVLMGIGLWTLSLRFSQTDTTGDRFGRLMDHLSVTRHMQDFARGVVDGRALVFHLSVSVFFLFLTQRVIEMRRWR